MKNILIISEPRTGSSNLLQSIASAYNFECQFEPDKKNKLKIKENSVVKIIVDLGAAAEAAGALHAAHFALRRRRRRRHLSFH